jgi:hypothetical protein
MRTSNVLVAMYSLYSLSAFSLLDINAEDAVSTMSYRRTTMWKPSVAQFLDIKTGRVIKVQGIQASYDLEDQGRRLRTLAIAAMAAPESHDFWIGPRQDVYFVVGNQLVGLHLTGSKIHWTESFDSTPLASKDSTITEEQLIAAAEKRISVAALVKHAALSVGKDEALAIEEGRDKERARKTTNYAEVLSATFAGRGSEVGLPTLSNASVEDGMIKLVIKSTDKHLEATIWLDPDHRVMTRAIENGKEMFREQRLPEQK